VLTAHSLSTRAFQCGWSPPTAVQFMCCEQDLRLVVVWLALLVVVRPGG